MKVAIKKYIENGFKILKSKMPRKNSIVVTFCFLLSCCMCDAIDARYNERYNKLLEHNNFKKSINSELRKEVKFFDVNDFDCKYRLHNQTSSIGKRSKLSCLVW